MFTRVPFEHITKFYTYFYVLKGRKLALLVYKSHPLAVRQMFYIVISFDERRPYNDYCSMDMGGFLIFFFSRFRGGTHLWL